MCTIFDTFVFAIGFASCWFAKDRILELVIGAEALARSLESRLGSLKARL